MCKIHKTNQIDFTSEFVFVAKTDDEISLVCDSAHVPKDTIALESGWKALKILGVLDFGMVGVIAAIANILQKTDIAIFVVSTYNTDYILIKSASLDRAVEALESSGYIIKKANQGVN